MRQHLSMNGNAHTCVPTVTLTTQTQNPQPVPLLTRFAEARDEGPELSIQGQRQVPVLVPGGDKRHTAELQCSLQKGAPPTKRVAHVAQPTTRGHRRHNATESDGERIGAASCSGRHDDEEVATTTSTTMMMTKATRTMLAMMLVTLLTIMTMAKDYG